MSEDGRQSAPSACERCKSPIEVGDLRCAVCALPVPAESEVEISEARARVWRCEQCGAAVAYNIEANAPTCAFCGCLAHIEARIDPLEYAALYLPFTVTEAEARAALNDWLRGLGFFRPSGLTSQATLDTLEPVWWVGWTFEVDALVSYAADSNHGAHRSAWAPHAGQRHTTMTDVVVSASRGLTLAETRALAPHFDLQSGLTGPHDLPETPVERVTVEQFDVQRSAARDIITAAVHEQARVLARSWVPGVRFRNLKVSVLPKKLYTKRYAFPTYVLAYRYRDKLYRALVHGQDCANVIGRAPWSIAKIGGVIAVLLAIVVMIVWTFFVHQ